MTVKVLVTGGGGMLGQDLARTVPAGIEVVALGREELDVTDGAAVRDRMSRVAPDRVIHCAAWTDVDGCELDPERAELVNGEGTRLMAEACAARGIPICYISTDFVFDGTKGSPYEEDDPTAPLSAYGRSKLTGEEHVTSLGERWFIVRSSWLFGRSGKNFVATILRLAGEPAPLRVVTDQIGSPTGTLDLARALWRLVPGERFGRYHITNAGHCSWHEFAREILTLAGVSREIVPVTGRELGRPAVRPPYSVLANTAWAASGFPPLPPYREALAEYLALLGYPRGGGHVKSRAGAGC